MQFPAQNTQINSVSGLTTEASKSIFPSTSAELSATGSYMVGSKSHGSSSVGLADKKNSHHWAWLNLCIRAHWRRAKLFDEFETGEHRNNSSECRCDHHSEKLHHAAHAGETIWVLHYFSGLVLQQNRYWARTSSDKHSPGQWYLWKQQGDNNE